MAILRPSDIARMAFSFMGSDQGKQMAEQWIPGILGSALSKKDEAVFDTLHNLLRELPNNGERLYRAIEQLFNDALQKHQRTQFRISIISLPLPTTKKESWGGEKKDKHATYETREELNISDQRVKNLAMWAQRFLDQGAEKTIELLINKNMISALSLHDQAMWALKKAKELGSPAWSAITGTPDWTKKADERIKKWDKWFFLPLAILIFILLIIVIASI